MPYLTKRGSSAYLRSSREALYAELIGWTHFTDRLRMLIALTSPNDPAGIYSRRLVAAESEWADSAQEDSFVDDNLQEYLRSQDSSVGGTEIDRVVDEGEPTLVLRFIARIPGMSNWQFHQSDPDFFPSIPHGHDLNNDVRKLDAYLGWVYVRTRQISRVPRSLIVELWNDEHFRFFASRAIDYYLFRYPFYRGWRVTNPRRLPRRR